MKREMTKVIGEITPCHTPTKKPGDDSSPAWGRILEPQIPTAPPNRASKRMGGNKKCFFMMCPFLRA